MGLVLGLAFFLAAQGPRSAGAPDESIEIEGFAVAVDSQGAEHPAENGSMSFWVERPGSGRALAPFIQQGRWSARVGAGDRLIPLAMKLGGRKAVVERGALDVPPDRVVRVVGRWPAPSSLRVVDARTGAPLRDIEVVAEDPSTTRSLPHPAGSNDVRGRIAAASSPVQLPPSDGETDYWVRARGYAWKHVFVDHRLGGAAVARLTTGATLEVAIAGPAVPNARLSFTTSPPNAAAPLLALQAIGYIPPGAIVLEGPFTELSVPIAEVRRITLDGLEPGNATVTLEAPGDAGRIEVLAKAEVELRAGESAEVVLASAPRPAAKPRVPLRGTLVIPAAWKSPHLGLEIASADPVAEPGEAARLTAAEMTPISGRPNAVEWDAGAARPGRYLINVLPWRMTFPYELKEGDDSGASLEMPGQATLLLRVVDRDGKDVEVHDVSWFSETLAPHGTASVGATMHGGAERDPVTRRTRMTAPSGLLVLSIEDDAYSTYAESFVLPAGETERTIRLAPLTAIRVVLKDGSRTLAWRVRDRLTIQPIDPPALPTLGWNTKGDASCVEVPGAGRYRVSFPAIQGFKRPKARRVNVEAGKVAEIVVPLERD